MGVCSIVQGPYALNTVSPMVFIFISGSLSRSVSLEYLVLYREYVFVDRSSFRYDGPIPISFYVYMPHNHEPLSGCSPHLRYHICLSYSWVYLYQYWS